MRQSHPLVSLNQSVSDTCRGCPQPPHHGRGVEPSDHGAAAVSVKVVNWPGRTSASRIGTAFRPCLARRAERIIIGGWGYRDGIASVRTTTAFGYKKPKPSHAWKHGCGDYVLASRSGAELVCGSVSAPTLSSSRCRGSGVATPIHRTVSVSKPPTTTKASGSPR